MLYYPKKNKIIIKFLKLSKIKKFNLIVQTKNEKIKII